MKTTKPKTAKTKAKPPADLLAAEKKRHAGTRLALRTATRRAGDLQAEVDRLDLEVHQLVADAAKKVLADKPAAPEPIVVPEATEVGDHAKAE